MELIFGIVIIIVCIISAIFSNIDKNKLKKRTTEIESSLPQISPSFEDSKHKYLSIIYDKNKKILRIKNTGLDSICIKDIQNVDISDIKKASMYNNPASWIIKNKNDNSVIYITDDSNCYHIVNDFNPTKEFSDKWSYLAIDMNNEKIVSLFNNYYEGDEGMAFNCINFSEISKVEISEDKCVVSSKSLLRTIGGAVAGNTVAGGAGMVVGGLSGDSQLDEKVEEINVRIVTNSLDVTQIEYLIEMEERKGVYRDDIRYKKARRTAQEIENIIGVILDENEKNNDTNKKIAGVADEIKKLSELRDSGILTENEYNERKTKLLDS